VEKPDLSLDEKGIAADLLCDVQELKVLGRTLVIGRRTNVLLGNDSLLYLPEKAAETARRRGKLFVTNAEDYFFVAFNDFPWQSVEDVVIGRPAYDNYLVGLAMKLNVTVVDATATLLALHQTDKDGNYAGHRNKDSGLNARHIGRFNYASGVTTAASYATTFSVDEVCNRTKVVVERRRKPHATRSPVRRQVLSTRSTTDAMSKSSRSRPIVSKLNDASHRSVRSVAAEQVTSKSKL